ncbi:unnamed protein product [Bursaphelenchus xylophilus]|uniref:(pine wood nematode) hypothetical protein n=1 Tax=Bursaphelenchus xylophilus TaxID=6326 RepID=A0A1I7SF21_BURXY|nr:unnamed protein product [Bursaphelenchus xylophilus]CAG9088892.1 unnamed protein product [Bursaphelenchus xylophilus]
MPGCRISPMETVFRIVSVLAVVVNALFVLLIKSKTPKMMISYRKVLYGSCAIDGLAALSHLLIGIRPIFVKDVLSFDFTGPIPRLIDYMGWLPDGKIGYILFFETVFMNSIVCYCFVPYTYRYFHMIRGTSFTIPKFLLLLLVYLSPAVVVATSLAGLSAQVYEKMTEFTGVAEDVCVRRVPMMDPRFYNEEPYATLAILANQFVHPVVVFPFLLVYFVVRIFRKLNEDVHRTSSAGIRIQKQITMTLTAQSVVPLLLVAIPFFNSCNKFAYGGDKEGAIRITMNSVCLVALVNPIVASLMVQSYRRTIMSTVTLDHLQLDTSLTSTTQPAVSAGMVSPVVAMSVKFFKI